MSDNIFNLVFYSVVQHYNNYSEILYSGIDYDDAIYKMNHAENDSKWERSNVILEKQIKKYKFIYKLDDEYETIEDYPIESYYKDKDIYELIDESEYEEIETREIENYEETARDLESEILEYLHNTYNRDLYKSYSDVILGEDGNGNDVFLQIRVKDHSENPLNKVKSLAEYFLSIVITNKNATAKRFNSGTELYFSGDDTLDEIKEEVFDYIQNIIDDSNIIKLSDIMKKAGHSINKNESLKRKIKNILKENTMKEYKERINQKLQERLLQGEHSLKNNPSFPNNDDFLKDIIGTRFDDVVLNVKRHFECEDIDNSYLTDNIMSFVNEAITIESKHKSELEKLAVKLVREEFDVPEDIELIAELTDDIKPNEASKKSYPFVEDTDFDSHSDIENANNEVYKRRILNAICQGAAVNSSKLIHQKEEDLININPLLSNKYNKIMAVSNYLYYVIDEVEGGVSGGVSKVEYPKSQEETPKIIAKGMLFPVLLHELIKGVMELLSYNALPQDKQLRKYVINKADYLNAEPDDMRLGVKLYEKLMKCVPEEDKNLKHHIYSELASLPAEEFHSTMKEIFSGTKIGKEKILNTINEVKKDIKKGEFEDRLNEKRMKHKESKYVSKPEELDLLLDEMKEI